MGRRWSRPRAGSGARRRARRAPSPSGGPGATKSQRLAGTRHRRHASACAAAASKHKTVAAMATLRLSARPGCGMVTRPSTAQSRRQAVRLVAEYQRARAARAAPRRRGRPPWRRHRGAARPTRPARRGRTSTTTGTWNSAPAEARTTFGLKTSTEPTVSTTASAPAASAERRMVPTLPGSARPAATTTNPPRRRPTAFQLDVGALHHGQHRLRRHGGGHPLDDPGRQLVAPAPPRRRPGRAPGPTYTASTGRPRRHRLGHAAPAPRSTNAPSS